MMNRHDNKNIFLFVKEASELLGVSPNTLRRWDIIGKFKADRHPINNYRMYKKDNLYKLLERIEKDYMKKILPIKIYR